MSHRQQPPSPSNLAGLLAWLREDRRRPARLVGIVVFITLLVFACWYVGKFAPWAPLLFSIVAFPLGIWLGRGLVRDYKKGD